jgi:rubrerythrin
MVRKMTEKTLQEAFAGESQANTKYQLYAEMAHKDGFANIARLFEAVAYAERVHARNHLKALGKKMGSADNLQDAIDGENFEVQEMYQAYLAVAKLQEEKAAVTSHSYALEAEKIHAEKYAAALKAVQGGRDIDMNEIYICPTCGYTVEDQAPERCPVCGVPGAKFRQF